MDRLTGIQVVSEIAERGSLAAAARSLRMSRAMVSRYLESVEQWLGLRLFHRTTRRVSITEAGEEALQRCARMLELGRELEAVTNDLRTLPHGRLRVSTPAAVAQRFLASAVGTFIGRYPQAQVEVLTSDRMVNLVESRIDLAVRIGNHLDESLVARKLGTCASMLCAAPEYLARHGAPRTPAQLVDHCCLLHNYVGRSVFMLRKGRQRFRVPVTGPLFSDDVMVLYAAMLAGAGVAWVPAGLVSAGLREGRLVQVLPDYEFDVMDIHAVYLSRRFQPLVLRLFLDFLCEQFREVQPDWHPAKTPIRKQSRAAAART